MWLSNSNILVVLTVLCQWISQYLTVSLLPKQTLGKTLLPFYVNTNFCYKNIGLVNLAMLAPTKAYEEVNKAIRNILWEIKYFKLISLEKKDDFAVCDQFFVRLKMFCLRPILCTSNSIIGKKSGKAKQSKAEVCFGLYGSFSLVFYHIPNWRRTEVESSLDRNRISGAQTLEFTVSQLKLVSLKIGTT
jgi:hypothetical protein